jgi:hypothetical protein
MGWGMVNGSLVKASYFWCDGVRYTIARHKLSSRWPLQCPVIFEPCPKHAAIRNESGLLAGQR